MLYCVLLLTSPRQDTAHCSVTNCSITGLNVHEKFATYSHEHPLLNTELWNTQYIQNVFCTPADYFKNFPLTAAKCYIKMYSVLLLLQPLL